MVGGAGVLRGSPLLGGADMDGEAHCLIGFQGASGAMDNASDYGSEDSRFDSWLARSFSFAENRVIPKLENSHTSKMVG